MTEFIELKQEDVPQWIKESDFYMSQISDENDTFCSQKDYILPDHLTDEDLLTVIRAVRYFGTEPSNFYRYIRKQHKKDIVNLSEFYSDKDLEYINMLIKFKNTNVIKLTNYACQIGNLNMLKEVYDIDFYTISNENKLEYAIFKDKLKTSKREDTYYAAKGGYLECLKFLKEKNAYFKINTCKIVVIGDYFECFKFLYDNHLYNHKEIPFFDYKYTKYAIDNGFYFDDYNFLLALIKYNNIEILEYVYDKLDKSYFEDGRFIYLAIQKSSIDVLKFLIEKGHEFDYNYHLLEPDLEIIEYLNSKNIFPILQYNGEE